MTIMNALPMTKHLDQAAASAVKALASRASEQERQTAIVLNAVWEERERQEELQASGRIKTDVASEKIQDLNKLPVLAEEFGEVAQEICKFQESGKDGADPEFVEYSLRLRTELIQLAAVCVAWAESIPSGRNNF